ncbi:MAG: ABC transporter permease, partial [Micrococcales bacterium]
MRALAKVFNSGVIGSARRSRGVQRFMLLTGLSLTALFLLLAAFAPLLAPYGYSQLQDAHGYFGSQQPPSSAHLLGTTVGGMDVL